MQIEYNKHIDEYGIDAKLHIDFIDMKNGKMNLLQCNISYGTYSCDFSFVVNHYTLAQVIRELVEYVGGTVLCQEQENYM